jgi:hypothetical protein
MSEIHDHFHLRAHGTILRFSFLHDSEFYYRSPKPDRFSDRSKMAYWQDFDGNERPAILNEVGSFVMLVGAFGLRILRHHQDWLKCAFAS